jgi:hypothetical protein
MFPTSLTSYILLLLHTVALFIFKILLRGWNVVS